MKRSAAYVATANNDPEGLKALANIRKHLRGTGFRTVRRGRNPDRKKVSEISGLGYWSTKNYVNVPYSTRFDLYLVASDRHYVRDEELTEVKANLALRLFADVLKA